MAFDIDWNVYPRPQLVREKWQCLNGEWDFACVRLSSDAEQASEILTSGGIEFSENIIVPYCPESALSGICRRMSSDTVMVYERTISLSEELRTELTDVCDGRIILHFGAVDQVATVFVNGTKMGQHEGGYLPFSFDITEAVDNLDHIRIKVYAIDTLDHKYPWGKQKNSNGGMWYTPVSGIWQTVWLEVVPSYYIQDVKLDVGLDWVEIKAYGIESGRITLQGERYQLVSDSNDSDERGIPSAHARIEIKNPQLWTPDNPYLYEFTIEALDMQDSQGVAESTRGDKVSSYFGLRTLTIKQVDGYARLCLNGEPFFFNGLLDQGYWPDGIYTPESAKAYQSDILAMKSLGFNTLRKHIKIEPEQFYYDCDRLGMIVFQDMVNNGEYSFIRDTALPTIGIRAMKDKRLHRDQDTRRIFLETMDETVRTLYNHPSICYWTIFNEGWGQFEADEAYERLHKLDSSRFIDSTSGWFWQNKSDVDSHHVYFKPLNIQAEQGQNARPLVLSEFGGYACKLDEHCFNKEKTYGYRKCADESSLLHDIAELYLKQVLPLAQKGLSAAIYTQVSDVEDETNGLLTYDREILKFKSYTGTGRIEILGNHTDHQGGRVLVAPSPHKIRSYVAENHKSVIRVYSLGFEPFEVSLESKSEYDKGTSAAIVRGILDGFSDLYGNFNGINAGIDIYVNSEVPVGSGLSSSAAFEILICRIINDRYYNNMASNIEIAKIAMFAEREYFGKPCGMMDQLAIAIGRPAMLDFGGKEVEIEELDFDARMLDNLGIEMNIIVTEDDHAALDEEFAAIPNDMFKVAEALGVSRLGDLNEVQFKRKLPELEDKIEKGELTVLQVNRAKHFYDECERVLAGVVALRAGNLDKFLQCINLSGHSSEDLLKNIVPDGLEDNELAKELRHQRTLCDVLAVRLIGGGFGGSVLSFKRKSTHS